MSGIVVRLVCPGRVSAPHESATAEVVIETRRVDNGARSQYFLCQHCGALFLGFADGQMFSAEPGYTVVPGVLSS